MSQTNQIILSLEQANINSVKLLWKHRLQYNNQNTSLSEKLQSLIVTVTSSIYWPNTQVPPDDPGITIKTINLTQAYYKGEYVLTLPTNFSTDFGGTIPYKTHTIAVKLTTKFGSSSSESSASIMYLAGPAKFNPPLQLVAEKLGSSIELSWMSPTIADGDLSTILGYKLEYSKNGGDVWYSTTLGNVTNYTFSNLSLNNSYIFRIKTYGEYQLFDMTVPFDSNYSNTTNPIYLSPNPTTNENFLFDHSSWSTIASPWREYLTFAAEEWESHVRMYPSVVGAIRKNYTDFLGIKVNVSFTSQPANNGLITVAYVPLNSITGFNLNPQDPYSIKWNSYSFNVVINTHPDVNSVVDSANEWRAILAHEFGHGLGIGVVWQPDVISALNKNFSLGINPITGVVETRSNLSPQDPRWQLNGTFRPPHLKQYGPAFPKAQEAYNLLSGYVGNRAPLKPRSVIPMISSTIFDTTNRRAHWAYDVNNYSNFTKGHNPIPNDIMSYGSFAGVEQQQVTPVSVGVLEDIGYERLANAASILTYQNQVSSGASSGYSSSVSTIPQNAIPREWPGDTTINQNQVKGTMELDLNNRTLAVKNVIFNLDSEE